MKNLRLQFQCKMNYIDDDRCIELNFSDGDEDEDDEGISERSLRRSPSDDGKSLVKDRIRRSASLYFQLPKIQTIVLKILIY